MNILSPKLTVAEVADATARKFTAAPVEAGEYDMVIKTAPKVLTSKAGNNYLQLMLTHTGETQKGATAVYPNFNLNDIGQRQFAQLLLSLGFSEAEVTSESTGWGIAADEADEAGRKPGAVMVDGNEVELEGRPVKVYLTKKASEYQGKETVRNEVARFIIG